MARMRSRLPRHGASDALSAPRALNFGPEMSPLRRGPCARTAPAFSAAAEVCGEIQASPPPQGAFRRPLRMASKLDGSPGETSTVTAAGG
jgi:hypothetical protein